MSDPVMRDLNRHLDEIDADNAREEWISNWTGEIRGCSAELEVKPGIAFSCYGCNEVKPPGTTLYVDPINHEISCENCFEDLMRGYAETALDEGNEI